MPRIIATWYVPALANILAERSMLTGRPIDAVLREAGRTNDSEGWTFHGPTTRHCPSGQLWREWQELRLEPQEMQEVGRLARMRVAERRSTP